MNAQIVTQYDSPQQFEPLMPRESMLGPLLEKASDLTVAASALGSSAGTIAHGELRALLRSMNSYYTNRMEGEHTRPSEIERALQDDFSANADLARKQRLAVAHVRTELECEATLDLRPLDEGNATRWLYSVSALKWLHKHLFGELSPADLTLADGSEMVIGEVRTRGVAVGRHEAPTPGSLEAFLTRWGQVYAGARRGEAAVVAIAASHHRLAWIHPFLDGNGRVARLHTHLLLHSMGLTNGLWSPLRGFARSEDEYKALLQAADEPRQGDLDGRGSLTEKGLIRWIEYTLNVCLDQVSFMSKQLSIAGMKGRIDAALTFDQVTLKSGVRREALGPLHYLFATQSELGRAEFKTMMGLGDRVATETVSALIRTGYLATDSAYGKLRFAIPRHALRFYFPALWPEAEQEQAGRLNDLQAEEASAIDRPRSRGGFPGG